MWVTRCGSECWRFLPGKSCCAQNIVPQLPQNSSPAPNRWAKEITEHRGRREERTREEVKLCTHTRAHTHTYIHPIYQRFLIRGGLGRRREEVKLCMHICAHTHTETHNLPALPHPRRVARPQAKLPAPTVPTPLPASASASAGASASIAPGGVLASSARQRRVGITWGPCGVARLAIQLRRVCGWVGVRGREGRRRVGVDGRELRRRVKKRRPIKVAVIGRRGWNGLRRCRVLLHDHNLGRGWALVVVADEQGDDDTLSVQPGSGGGEARGGAGTIPTVSDVSDPTRPCYTQPAAWVARAAAAAWAWLCSRARAKPFEGREPMGGGALRSAARGS